MIRTTSTHPTEYEAQGIALTHRIREAQWGDVDRLVEIHIEAFSDQRSSQLGDAYVRAGHEWFMSEPDVVRLAATLDRRVVGFIEGAPDGYAKRKDRALAFVALRALLSRPRLFMQAYFRLAMKQWIRRRLDQPMIGIPRQNVFPEPSFALVSIAMAKEARGLGIAGTLMKAFEDEVKRRGFASLRLSVKRTNLSAVRAYKKAGWNKVNANDPYGDYYYKIIGAPAEDRSR